MIERLEGETGDRKLDREMEGGNEGRLKRVGAG